MDTKRIGESKREREKTLFKIVKIKSKKLKGVLEVGKWHHWYRS